MPIKLPVLDDGSSRSFPHSARVVKLVVCGCVLTMSLYTLIDENELVREGRK